ncbi:MAG: hypothetical protein KGI98_15580 [Euryarchaeota archaeon]|nr:hypothetical protein [Euryarchaeota archaeon]
MGGIQPDEGKPAGDGSSSTYSSLGTKGVKPGPGGSNFPKSDSVQSVGASLKDAEPEVRSGLEWPATATDSGHN